MSTEKEEGDDTKQMEERSDSKTSLNTDTDQLIDDLAKDYSNYMNFDLTKEQGRYNESIEDMLTRLDEFCGLVDMIRSDTSLCLNKTVPDIQSKCAEMESIFERIDKLEAFVAVVKQSVTLMEDNVGRAEDDFSSIGGFMKKITSIVSPKRKEPNRQTKETGFVPPEIFRTSDYLAPSVAAKPTDGASAS